MDTQQLPCRIPVAYASANDFAANTLRILARLGYDILSPEKFEELRSGPDGDPDRQPDLFIVDESRLRELPASDSARNVPIVVVARSHATPEGDPRVVASVKPPIGMHDLYRVLQQVFEDRPRTAPRIRTELPGVCRRSGREWNATVVSLSENGCLLRSSEPVPLGTSLQLAFKVPGSGTVHIKAEMAYQLLPDLGLVFSSIAPRIREVIAHHVAESLLCEDPAEPSPSR